MFRAKRFLYENQRLEMELDGIVLLGCIFFIVIENRIHIPI